MTNSFIQPKGSLKTQVDTRELQHQLAKMFANQQLQGQAQAQAEALDPMRQTVNDLLKNKLLQEIKMPKYTTLNDVLSANKGDKLGVFADFLNNPQIMRTIGSFLPKYGYNPTTGKMGNIMEEPARRQEAQMEADRQKALAQMKEQNDIATSMNSLFTQQDIANERNKLQRELAQEELKWKAEQNALDRALTREHQRAMEGIARDRLAASGTQQKQLQKNIEALNSLNAIQGQMDRFSNSFKDVRGSKVGALLANAYASKGFGNEAEANFNAQRTLLFNKIARELGGEKGVLSDQDIKRIETSLPSLSDSLSQKKAKMKAIYDLLDDRKSQYGGAVSAGVASQMNNDPLGLGF